MFKLLINTLINAMGELLNILIRSETNMLMTIGFPYSNNMLYVYGLVPDLAKITEYL